MGSQHLPVISADNEWSPLEAVIVGRAEHSAFPSEPPHMISATMPNEFASEFRPNNPFPADILAKAQEELDHFASVLEKNGVRVYRPEEVNWLKEGGYTGAMPRDCFMTVGNALIEAPFSWGCRRREVELGYSNILGQISTSGCSARICRAPVVVGKDTLYNGLADSGSRKPANGQGQSNDATRWAINNSRPAFDTADFLRFGKTIIGQLSHVTNRKGVEYLQAMVPEGYTVEILKTTDEHAMHIDATILPLRKGILVYHPGRVSEEELRRHAVFADWELHTLPFEPKARENPPMYMCSKWLILNALSLDERRIFVEAKDTQFAEWIKEQFGMEPVMVPFQHVNSIGGSFHCATVDLVRSA